MSYGRLGSALSANDWYSDNSATVTFAVGLIDALPKSRSNAFGALGLLDGGPSAPMPGSLVQSNSTEAR